MSDSDQTQYQELTIDSLPGLEEVSGNVEAQYKIGLKKEATQFAVGDYAYSEALHEAAQAVRNTLSRLKEKVKQDIPIEQTEADELQHNYDRLVRLVKRPTATPRAKTATTTDTTPTAEGVDAMNSKKKTSATDTQILVPPPEFSSAARRSDSEFKVNRQATKAVMSSEQTDTKPKTGPLSIRSDDKETTKHERDSVSRTKPSGVNIPIKSKVTEPATTAQVEEVKNLVKKFRRQLNTAAKEKPVSTDSRSLMYEEAQEGIEQLEVLSKKTDLTKQQFSRVTDITKHVKQSLEALRTATVDTVPVVTRGAGGDKTKKQPSVSFVPTSVTNQRQRVARRTVPRPLQTLPKPNSIYQEESLTKRYLDAPRHQQWLRSHYSSPKAFEQVIDATITKIEAETIDPIEKWLGELPASAFSLIKDMTVSDVISFARRPYEAVAADLQQENVKYETFAAWRDLIDEMLELVPNGKTMRFGQLFAVFMVELEMQSVE